MKLADFIHISDVQTQLSPQDSLKAIVTFKVAAALEVKTSSLQFFFFSFVYCILDFLISAVVYHLPYVTNSRKFSRFSRRVSYAFDANVEISLVKKR